MMIITKITRGPCPLSWVVTDVELQPPCASNGASENLKTFKYARRRNPQVQAESRGLLCHAFQSQEIMRY